MALSIASLFGGTPSKGYNPNSKASSGSFDGRMNAEWGDVQATQGSMYVPDVAASMDVTTMQINMSRLDKGIAKFSAKPVPSWLGDLYEKEKNGKGASVTAVMNEIVSYLQAKRAAYAAAIAKKTGIVPAPSVTTPTDIYNNPVTTPATDNNDTPTTDNPTNNTTTNNDTATNDTVIDPKTGLPVKKSNTKLYLILGGIALLVIVTTLIVVKKRKA